MSIKIFSWNVFWKNMTGIGCNYTMTCRDNVLKIINDLKLKKYDFIALQEASNLYNELKNKDNYEIIFSNNNKFNPNDKDSTNKLITLYDSNKYRLLTKRYGSIDGYNSTGKPSKRPFHILFLQDNNNNKILFINLHNVHDVKRNLFDLQKAINNIINGPNLPIYNIPEDVHIIISGDFNDKETQYYIKGLHIQINQINQTNKVVKSIATPPKTCCLSHYTFIGDYILYSNNLNPIIDNTIFNYDKTNSDHYPVHIHLKYQVSATSSTPLTALEELSVLINKYIDLLEKN
jgi:hypothetical protein